MLHNKTLSFTLKHKGGILAKSTKSDDKELLIKLDNYFSSALDHPTWQSWRTNAEKCFKYKEGDQRTSTEKQELKNRGQPETVNNQVKVTLDRMVGQFVRQRTRIGYRGRNPQDKQVADTLSDALLFIKQQNNLEFEERDAAEDGFTGGFGVLEAYIDYNDLLNPEIKIRMEDCFNIFPDPYSRRYDWNEDANHICRAKWLDLSEAKELYTGKSKELSQIMEAEYKGGLLSSIDGFKKNNYIDANAKRLRVVECWYKTKKKDSKVILSTGQILDADQLSKDDLRQIESSGITYKQVDRIKTQMKVGVYSAGVLLEHKDSPFEHGLFPFIPYFVNRKKSGEPYSLIYTALTLQDAINKRESKALHLLSTNQSIYEKGAVTDPADHATEVARPDGQIELNKGYFEKFILNKNIDLAVTQFNLHNEAKADFRRVTGINPDAMGEKSEMRSGIGVARKQAMTDLIISPVFDNFRRTRTILTKVVLGLIKQYYTDEMLFYITDDLNKSRTVKLNANANEQQILKEGIFDIVIDEMPDITTMQQEQFEMLAQMLPAILPFGPFWVKKLIQLSDLKNKDEVIKEIEAMTGPPPPDPKLTVALQWSELDPMEKATFAEKMGMNELAMYEAQSGGEPAHITKTKSDMAKEMMKSKNDTQKSEMDIAKSMMDMSHKRESHVIDMEKKRKDNNARNNNST